MQMIVCIYIQYSANTISFCATYCRELEQCSIIEPLNYRNDSSKGPSAAALTLDILYCNLHFLVMHSIFLIILVPGRIATIRGTCHPVDLINLCTVFWDVSCFMLSFVVCGISTYQQRI